MYLQSISLVMFFIIVGLASGAMSVIAAFVTMILSVIAIGYKWQEKIKEKAKVNALRLDNIVADL